MKKNKSKKNHKVNRYNGRNLYGQRCIAKTVTLEKETALEQYLDILDDVEAHKRKGETLEYTVFSPGFTKEELEELNGAIERVMAFRARMNNTNFLTAELKTA